MRTSWRIPNDVDLRVAVALAVVAALVAVPLAALDVSRASVSRLANGLTLIVLEDPTLPVASVQMLYRVGARNEESGRTGLAHFLEHMAFRASENFPDTEVVSAIYAVGGEWHGYTWLDETTYFATVPREHLDLLLRIEADRMARLEIAADLVEPERGAILAEMHGYENDPQTVLMDATIAASFQQHPYRLNTIGWQSDVESIRHDDLVDFYRRHYHPSNAVLAVVGDVDTRGVEARVRQLFESYPKRPPTELPRTVEPPQRGERRVMLQGADSASYFEVVYRAPPVGDPDWSVFLVLQEILAGGEGVNFAQSSFGVPAREGSPLFTLADDVATWFPPMAQPYVFAITGSVTAGSDPGATERDLEARLAAVRNGFVDSDELTAARRRVQAELVFDVETPEDAAHQLAYFAGLKALDALFDLPSRVEAVSAADVARVARSYLRPEQRTAGWYRAGPSAGPPEGPPVADAVVPALSGGTAVRRPQESPRAETASEPVLISLDSGLPVIVRRVPRSPTAHLRILVPTTSVDFPVDAVADEPVWRHTSLNFRFLVEELDSVLRRARTALVAGTASPAAGSTPSEDPEARLEQAFAELLDLEPPSPAVRPVVIAVAGDVEPALVLPRLAEAFGDLGVGSPPTGRDLRLEARRLEVSVEVPRAQAQLGYVVPAPAPRDEDFRAWQMVLYILSHGYEGRLGKEAISRRGLLYYIDAGYRTDGANGLVSLQMGVDPEKLEAMHALLVDTLAELASDPPSATEVLEAKQHLIGRQASAHQSNEEITAKLVEEWVGLGRLPSAQSLAHDLESVERRDLLRILPEFVSGATVVVEVEP